MWYATIVVFTIVTEWYNPSTIYKNPVIIIICT